jgi:hypothetical protein
MSTDPYDLRPPGRPLRIAILIAAVACLGLTMCVSSEHKRPPAKPTPPAQAAPQPQAKPQDQQKYEEGKMKEDSRYFNASKAPGAMY